MASFEADTMFSPVSMMSDSEGSGRCRQIARFILLLSSAQLLIPTMAIGGSMSM